MTFPANCIRGIPHDDYLNAEGNVNSHLFHFNLDPNSGWKKQSINWEDDNTVIEFTLKQKKDNDELQFKTGVAVILRSEIDRLNQRPTVENLLSYERDSLDLENPYHGNILLQPHTSKRTMKVLAAGLALAVSKVVLR
ncbi:MAG: hypothetical protein IIB44_01090 [Candidatus Marinimicrobia bacterium]|nr:hypothetical protein [Candidatus Neomarinimicrobiota bacterium]MCH8069301.1 hypothetical protein [Candidatus Neomarinimicrobiota bacterium]